jgi:hypothetical protein
MHDRYDKHLDLEVSASALSSISFSNHILFEIFSSAFLSPLKLFPSHSIYQRWNDGLVKMIDSLEAHAPPSTIATQPDAMPGQAVAAFASASSATVYHDTGTPTYVDSSPRFVDSDDTGSGRFDISSTASNRFIVTCHFWSPALC